MFSESPGKAITEYREFVEGDESQEIKDFVSKKNLPSILGSRKFIEWGKAKYYQTKKHDEVPPSKDLAPTNIEIKKAVGLCYKIDIKELEKIKRGQEKEPRSVVRRIESQLADRSQLSFMVTLIRQRLSLAQQKIWPLFVREMERKTIQ